MPDVALIKHANLGPGNVNSRAINRNPLLSEAAHNLTSVESTVPQAGRSNRISSNQMRLISEWEKQKDPLSYSEKIIASLTGVVAAGSLKTVADLFVQSMAELAKQANGDIKEGLIAAGLSNALQNASAVAGSVAITTGLHFSSFGEGIPPAGLTVLEASRQRFLLAGGVQLAGAIGTQIAFDALANHILQNKEELTSLVTEAFASNTAALALVGGVTAAAAFSSPSFAKGLETSAKTTGQQMLAMGRSTLQYFNNWAGPSARKSLDLEKHTVGLLPASTSPVTPTSTSVLPQGVIPPFMR